MSCSHYRKSVSSDIVDLATRLVIVLYVGFSRVRTSLILSFRVGLYATSVQHCVKFLSLNRSFFIVRLFSSAPVQFHNLAELQFKCIRSDALYCILINVKYDVGRTLYRTVYSIVL